VAAQRTSRTWLGEAPAPYPSYTDPHHELAQSYKVLGLPDTAFYNRRGQLVWLKQGNYRDAKELERKSRSSPSKPHSPGVPGGRQLNNLVGSYV